MEKVKTINKFLRKHSKAAVIIFFAAYLLGGLLSFNRYGVSWDEARSRFNGYMACRYVFSGDDALFSYRDRYYGTAFEAPLVFLEVFLKLKNNVRAVFFMRHLATFLIFYAGVIFFYLLCRRRFNSRLTGLLGAVFLVLSPRIYAHSFYNSKDIPFLAMFIIAVYSLQLFMRRRGITYAFMHALTCALLIDIRITGVILPVFTAGLFIAELCSRKAAERRGILIDFAGYLLFLCGLTICFWPLLWRHPAANFAAAFAQMSKYPWQGLVLYMGKYLRAADLPWHYIPVWIMISTPVIYIVLFLCGLAYDFQSLRSGRIGLRQKQDLLYLAWFFLPLFAVIGLKANLYDGWRQMFFIYPALLIIALQGVRLLRILFERKNPAVWKSLCAAGIACLLWTGGRMIQLHPYENIYFNIFAGHSMHDIKQNFDLDYWGLSYRAAEEYVLGTDKSPVIRIFTNAPVRWRVNFLTRERERLKYVKEQEEADYLLSAYRLHRQSYDLPNEYFSIKIGGEKIMVVYKLKKEEVENE